jgi:hypothetical protein
MDSLKEIDSGTNNPQLEGTESLLVINSGTAKSQVLITKSLQLVDVGNAETIGVPKKQSHHGKKCKDTASTQDSDVSSRIHSRKVKKANVLEDGAIAVTDTPPTNDREKYLFTFDDSLSGKEKLMSILDCDRCKDKSFEYKVALFYLLDNRFKENKVCFCSVDFWEVFGGTQNPTAVKLEKVLRANINVTELWKLFTACMVNSNHFILVTLCFQEQQVDVYDSLDKDYDKEMNHFIKLIEKVMKCSCFEKKQTLDNHLKEPMIQR